MRVPAPEEQMIYIRLPIFNYEKEPHEGRVRVVKRVCKSVQDARRMAARLKLLIGPAGAGSKRTEHWVDRHYGVKGCILSVDGIFREVTTKIEEES